MATSISIKLEKADSLQIAYLKYFQKAAPKSAIRKDKRGSTDQSCAGLNEVNAVAHFLRPRPRTGYHSRWK